MLLLMRKTKKGVFTVEASFLFPILILLTAFFLQMSITLYSEIDQAAEDMVTLREIDSVKNFLLRSQIESFVEIIPGGE